MKPIAEVKREDFIKKMFPYTMDFSFVTYWVDEDLPLLEQVEHKIEVKMHPDSEKLGFTIVAMGYIE